MPPRYGDDYRSDERNSTRPRGSRSRESTGYYAQGYPGDSYPDAQRPRGVVNAVPSALSRQPLQQIPPSAGEPQYMHAPGHADQDHYGTPFDDFHGLSSGQTGVPGPGSYQGYPPPNGQPPNPNMDLTSPQQYDSHHSPRRGSSRSESTIFDGHPAVISTLDPRYVLQPRSYYTTGKIFAILWHENYGMSNGHGNGTVITHGPTFTGRFNEPIYSAIRRMVVFSTTGQKSLCFPISTYGNRGVAKPNVDPDTHAIVYPRGTSPIREANEPRMIKEPLEVAVESYDETLNPMSRLDFGKIHTVEHNVKVLPIGRITSKSMTRFMQYTRDEMNNLVY